MLKRRIIMVDYKKEIKRALKREAPYTWDQGLFQTGIILHCQAEVSEKINDFVLKAEIREELEDWLSGKTNDENIVIKTAKEYIDKCIQKDKEEKELNKFFKKTIKEKYSFLEVEKIDENLFKLSIKPINLDRSVNGFHKRAVEFVKKLNIPFKIKDIVSAYVFPPLHEEDYEKFYKNDPVIADCFVKRTSQEIEEARKKDKELMERNIIDPFLDSPYKMVRYAGINIIFEWSNYKKTIDRNRGFVL